MTATISFNGTDYASPDDMPPAIRAAYQRALDMAGQGKPGGLLRSNVTVKVSTRMRFMHEGKAYDSLDDLPPEVRAKYQAAMQQVDKDNDGVPDFLEGNAQAPSPSQAITASAPLSAFARSPAAPPSQPSVTQADQPRASLLLVAGVVIVFLLLIVLGLLVYIYHH